MGIQFEKRLRVIDTTAFLISIPKSLIPSSVIKFLFVFVHVVHIPTDINVGSPKI